MSMTTKEATKPKEKMAQNDSSNAELEQLSQEISEALAKGEMTLKEAFDMPQDKLDMMYALAYDLYQNDKYEKATKIFNVLCIYDPLKLDYWLGLGACQKMLEQYEGAIMAYHTVLSLDPSNFVSYLDMAECLFKLKQLPAAKKFVEAMLLMSKDGKLVPSTDRNRAALQKAQVMMTLLEKVS